MLREMFGLQARDWLAVTGVALVSILLSVVFTGLSVGWKPRYILPAVLIPFCVSVPVSSFVYRQQRLLKRHRQELIEHISRDQLTGLLSRRRFLASLKAKARSGGALILIDVDQFKAVNDNFGHPAGDAVLVELADRFRAAVDDEILVGRLGGEEFAAFIPVGIMGTGMVVGEAIRQNVRSRPFPSEKGPIHVSVSVGLTVLRPYGDVSAAIAAADEALYRAKSLGRDQICVAC